MRDVTITLSHEEAKKARLAIFLQAAELSARAKQRSRSKESRIELASYAIEYYAIAEKIKETIEAAKEPAGCDG